MRHTSRILGSAVAVCAALLARVGAAADDRSADWFTAWATVHAPTIGAFGMQSFRMILQLSAGGEELRVQIRNQHGATPVVIGQAAVGIVEKGATLVPGSNRPLTFGGNPGITVPAGADALSDPVALTTVAQQYVAVSLYLAERASPSQDLNAYQTSYRTAIGGGNHVMEEAGTSFPLTGTAMILVGAVDVRSKALRGAIVAAGASTTDGMGSDGRAADAAPSPSAILAAQPQCSPCRWTDFLARRIAAARGPARWSVANAGLNADTTDQILARFDADVLSRSGVSSVVVFSGANDLTGGDDAASIIASLREAIARVRAHGASAILATIPPRASFTPVQNAERAAVNEWLRAQDSCGGECDGLVDFDAVLAWPLYPDAIDPRYDSGDNIHPNAAGYQALADAIDLGLFR